MHAKVVLITGEQGFLGSRLLQQLSTNFVVHPFNADVTDRQLCFQKVHEIKPDVIIHLAALSLPKQCDDNPPLANLVNIEGTKNVAEATGALNKPVHFIFTSTAQIYDFEELSKGIPVDEACKVKPQNLYAETKWRAEEILREQITSPHLHVTTLRLFNHVHKSQQSATFMSSVYSQILKLTEQKATSGKIIVGDIDLYRELNPVQSLMALFVFLCNMEPTYTFEAFNVCSGKSRKLRDIAEAFAQYFKMSLEFKQDPSLVRKNDPKKFVGSNLKIKTQLDLAYPELSDIELVQYFCSDL